MAIPGRQQPRRGVHPSAAPARGAAELRKRLRRELRRTGAADVSLYIDGSRGTARVRTAGREASVPVGEGLEVLRSLADGAGVEAVLDALART